MICSAAVSDWILQQPKHVHNIPTNWEIHEYNILYIHTNSNSVFASGYHKSVTHARVCARGHTIIVDGPILSGEPPFNYVRCLPSQANTNHKLIIDSARFNGITTGHINAFMLCDGGREFWMPICIWFECFLPLDYCRIESAHEITYIHNAYM